MSTPPSSPRAADPLAPPPERPRGLAGWLWRAYEHVAGVIGLGSLALICLLWSPWALVLHAVLPAATARRVGRSVIMRGFRFYTGILQTLCACRFDLRALDQLAREGQPLILVANHPSLLDAVLICSRLPNAVCIMKAALMRNPLFGAGARLAGYVVADSPFLLLRHGIDELAAGATLLVFPESTRSRTPPVSPCAATAGVLSARSGVAVQVLLIDMSPWYLGKGWPIWRAPHLPLRVRMRLGERFIVAKPGLDFGTTIEQHLRTGLTPPAMPPADTPTDTAG